MGEDAGWRVLRAAPEFPRSGSSHRHAAKSAGNHGPLSGAPEKLSAGTGGAHRPHDKCEQAVPTADGRGRDKRECEPFRSGSEVKGVEWVVPRALANQSEA